MATVAAKRLAQAAIGTSPATIYTVPGSTTTILKSFDICNTGSRVLQVRVHLVNSGDSAGTANALLYDYIVPASGLFGWEGEEALPAGTTIQVSASAAGLTIHASGVEIGA